METVKDSYIKLLRQYRKAVCAFEQNPTDAAIEKIAAISQKIKALDKEVANYSPKGGNYTGLLDDLS